MPSLIRSWSSSREIDLFAVISRKAAIIWVALFIAAFLPVMSSESRGAARGGPSPTKDQVRAGDLRQRDLHLLAVRQPQPDPLLALGAGDPQEDGFQLAPPAGERLLPLHPHLGAREALPVAAADQRPLHAGGGDLQDVAVGKVLALVQERLQRAA